MIESIFCLHVDGSITGGGGEAFKRQFAVCYQCQ